MTSLHLRTHPQAYTRRATTRSRRLLVVLAWVFVLTAIPGMVWGAPADNRAGDATQDLEQITPKKAWILESVSVTVASVGFVVLAVGATVLGRRDQLIEEAKSPSLFGGPSTPPKATEVKELQDAGFPLLVTGLIVAGIGAVGMIAGGIWLLTHKPKAAHKTSTKVSRAHAPPSAPAQAHTLLQTR